MTADPVPAPVIADLTPMQRAIAIEVANDGASNATIARRLHIAPQTVSVYMVRILDASGCPNRTALALALVRGQVKIRVAEHRTRLKEAA